MSFITSEVAPRQKSETHRTCPHLLAEDGSACVPEAPRHLPPPEYSNQNLWDLLQTAPLPGQVDHSGIACFFSEHWKEPLGQECPPNALEPGLWNKELLPSGFSGCLEHLGAPMGAVFLLLEENFDHPEWGTVGIATFPVNCAPGHNLPSQLCPWACVSLGIVCKIGPSYLPHRGVVGIKCDEGSGS